MARGATGVPVRGVPVWDRLLTGQNPHKLLAGYEERWDARGATEQAHLQRGSINWGREEPGALGARASEESSTPLLLQEQMQKRARPEGAGEDLGAPGKNAVEKSHGIAAVGPFAKTGRKKGEMALYQGKRGSSHRCIGDTGQ